MGYSTKDMERVFHKHAEKPILTRTQFARLHEKMREGDERESARAKAKLVEHNIFLVVNLTAKFYRGRRVEGMAFEDLFQEGMRGLLHAIEKFEPSRGHAFSTYATWWIRQKIQRAHDDQDKIIRRPVHTRAAISRFKRIENELTDEYGNAPTMEETWEVLLERYPKTYSGTLEIFKNGFERQVLSLDKQISFQDNSAGDTTTLGDFLEDPAPEPEDEAISGVIGAEQLEEALHCLSRRQERIIRHYYGLRQDESLYDHSATLDVVGKAEGITRERVRQILLSAKEEMRRFYASLGYPVPSQNPDYDKARGQLQWQEEKPGAIDVARLRKRRESLMSRAQLAEKAEILKSQVERIEQGNLIPPYAILRRIAKALNLNMESLLVPESEEEEAS